MIIEYNIDGLLARAIDNYSFDIIKEILLSGKIKYIYRIVNPGSLSHFTANRNTMAHIILNPDRTFEQRRDMISLLMKYANLDLNHREDGMRLPLSIAITYNYPKMVKFLLDNGANPWIKDGSSGWEAYNEIYELNSYSDNTPKTISLVLNAMKKIYPIRFKKEIDQDWASKYI